MVAEVIRARGVKGELLVRPTTAGTERFLSIRSVWVANTRRDRGEESRPRRETVRTAGREARPAPESGTAGREAGEGEEQPTWRNFPVEWSKSQGSLALVKLKGIDSREAAMGLSGLTLDIPRSEVPPHPEGEHYMFELVGMKVTRTDGVEVGAVADVIETGSNLVYLVKDARGKETLIPATRDVVEKLDYRNSVIIVRPVPGLFDE